MKQSLKASTLGPYVNTKSCVYRTEVFFSNFLHPPPPMATHVHPGNNQPLSQLVTALNEELSHAAHSRSYVDSVCEAIRGRTR